MKSIFVSGTDTDVGKTVLTAALVAAARANGHRVVPMKPVQTGCDEVQGHYVAPDLEFILRMAGLEDLAADREALCPYRYAPACSPHLAAEQAHECIALDPIVQAYQALAAQYEAVIVEGAGGVLVPLNPRENMCDLMQALGLSVVIAARPGLGTLNHTLLTVEALRARGMDVLAVVFVQSTTDPIDAIAEDNRRAIAQRSGLPVLGPLPYIPTLNTPDFTPASFTAMMTPHITPLLDLLLAP